MPTPGFTFREAVAGSIAGPLSSVLAVRRALAPRTSEATEPPATRPQSAPALPADEPRSRGWREP
jgi:hypothetical protein